MNGDKVANQQRSCVPSSPVASDKSGGWDNGRSTGLRQAVIRVRNDLRFTPQALDGQAHYLIEDPARSKFYRIGLPEYTFISLLDGKTAVGDAIRLTAEAVDNVAFGQQDAATICRWLLEANLARVVASGDVSCQTSPSRSTRRRSGWQRLNPMVLRLPLLFPDAWFRRVIPWLGWLYSRPAFVAWCLLVAITGYCVTTEWDRFIASSHRVLAPANWLWLGLCWLGLKGLHEASHGVVCRKYGGRVREMGVVLILFTPIAYVDVTSSWRFRSKWQRVFTAAAGMYAELLIAAVAVLAWSCTDRGWLNQLCFNIVTMASVTTVLFNANPLMRFDGYYVLSDLTGIPNLYTSGQQFLRYCGRRYLLGIRDCLPEWSLASGALIRSYALAAFCWRIVVCAGLLIAASALFHGAGIILAAFGVATWLVAPVLRFGRRALRAGPTRRPNWFRLAAVLTSVTMVVAALAGASWPAAVRAPAFVEYAPLTVIRAASDGFVEEIFVSGGQSVKEGQVLAVLQNRELRAQLADVELRIDQSRIRSRQHQGDSEIAMLQAEAAARDAMEKQRDELRREVDGLTIRAPRSGKIIGRNLASLRGMYAEKGTQLLEIGNEEHKELRLSVAQDDIDRFADRRGQQIHVRLPGKESFLCSLTSISPSASVEPPHPALCAPFGGPLTVCRKASSADHASPADDLKHELIEPRFTGTVRLERHHGQRLRAGQIGVVTFHDGRETIGAHLHRIVSDWVQRRQGLPGGG